MSDELALEEEFAQAQLTRKTYNRAMSYIRPYRWKVIISVILEVLWVGSTVLDVVFIKRILDKVIPAKDLTMAAIICGAFVVNILLRYFIALIEVRLLYSSGMRMLNDIRIDVFRKIESLHMGYFDKTKEGRIIARADRDVDTLEPLLVWGPTWLMNCVTYIIYAVTMMAVYDWRLCLIVMIPFPVLIVIMNLFRIKGMTAYRTIREALSRISSYLAETINGIRIIKAFGRERDFLSRFGVIKDEYRKTVVKQVLVWNIFYPAINIINAVATILILVFGGMYFFQGQISVGTLVAFLMFLGMFFGPIEGLSNLYNVLLSAAAAAERIFLLLDTESKIREKKSASELPSVMGKVEFRKVDFRYDKKTDWILKDIAFTASPGDCVALVGHTGSGKTSILSLIIRFYENEKGHVIIDDKEVKDLKLSSLRKNVGIVLQDNFLFSGTVMENLKYGRPDISDAEVKRKSAELGSDEVIRNLDKGYNTQVRERGAGISIGERQLICLTRVFIANPAIIILDEATSSVDTKTEKIIQVAMQKILKHRTTFIAAHRLSTIRNADKILVIDKGRIVEQGDFNGLMRKKGYFTKLYKTYTR